MGLFENVKRGANSLFCPEKSATGKLSISASLKIYYPIAIISTIIYIALASIMHFYGIVPGGFLGNYYSMMGYVHGFGAAGILGKAIGFALFALVLIPIGIFINAAIYHAVGKYLLKAFNGTYEKTFAAATFGEMPLVLFYWLTALPVAGIVFIGIFAVWGIIVFIIALAAQQKTTRVSSAVVLFATVFIVVILAMLFAALYSIASLPKTVPPGYPYA
ncbi:MAG: hypothetical protein QW696_03365 [Candidatus Micrarchaeaceae archaeon]